MKILLEHARLLGREQLQFVSVTEEKISYVGPQRPEGEFDRVIDCTDKLLMPGLYNCHTHSAMTLFRGYGEDMPLDSWLNNCIFPAEDRLTSQSVQTACQWAAMEQIKNGIVSCSDMYFFCEEAVKAFGESGMKANISRSVVSFDPEEPIEKNTRFQEANALFDGYHQAYDGRIQIEYSLHAEYTNTEKTCREFAQKVKERGGRVHIHLSETEKEHLECIARHGVTPARFFSDCGVFDNPTLAAHCVYLTQEDMQLLAEKSVTVVHNPCSNLKLGSGVMPLEQILSCGINVALGSDGTASNNTLDILKEMYTCAITQKGYFRRPEFPRAQTVIDLATCNGAKAQGREDCGKIETGYRADLILLDLDTVHTIPYYAPEYALLYSANASNVVLTMVDGRILYENGEWKTLDAEKLKYEMKATCANYFRD